MSEEATAAQEPPTPAAASAPASAPAPKRSISRWLTPVLAGLALLVIGLFGGILIGQHMTSARGEFPAGAAGRTFPGGQNGFPGQNGQGLQGGQGIQGGGFTSGTISSIDGDSIVIELANGTKVTVTTSDSTTVRTTEESEVSDLEVGDRISVVGQKDGDKVAARSITEGDLPGSR
jgi:cell division septal protein FtsQ